MTVRFGALPVVILLAGGCLLGGCINSSDRDSGSPLPPEQDDYEVTYYDLDVAVNPAQKRLEGDLTVNAVARHPLDRLVLNLDHRLSVEKVWPSGIDEMDALPLDRRNDSNELWIGLRDSLAAGDTARVTVRYSGEPREAPQPPWEGGLTWAETPSGAPWVATSGQLEGADLWWPVKDHLADEPDSMDIAITVPDSLVAASNGTLRGVERTSDSTRTYRWHVSSAINAYGVTLNVAPYVRIDSTYSSTSGEEVPVSLYALPEDASQARTSLPHFLDQLRYLEETLGPYPFRADKYGVAQTPFLGMEHQTLIAYGHDFSRSGGLGYDAEFDALHFHELAHEWYGNCVTADDWKDFWLHEGMATYLEALYSESRSGPEEYRRLLETFRAQIDGATPIARRNSVSARQIYSRDVYYKGALVLHTLRHLIGADALRTLLRRFADPNPEQRETASRCRHVNTSDFVALAESQTGRDLEGFVDTYLYQSELPRLETTRTDTSLSLTWTQTSGPFEVPVPLTVDGTRHRVAMDGGEGVLEVPANARVEIDPRGWVLREQ